jgi:hypothetical protein
MNLLIASCSGTSLSNLDLFIRSINSLLLRILRNKLHSIITFGQTLHQISRFHFSINNFHLQIFIYNCFMPWGIFPTNFIPFFLTSTKPPWRGKHRKHHFQQFLYCCVRRWPSDGSSTVACLWSCCLAMAVSLAPYSGCQASCHNRIDPC